MPQANNTKPTLLSRIVWRLLRWLFNAKAYRLENHPPKLPKFILVGAPHTSNWDFIYFAGAVQEVGIKPSFIGKHTLFKWPMTRFMYDMGGMPIDRSAPRGYVNSVIDRIEAADEIALVIAAEGSRTTDGRWRSGFYHIAHGAGVPIVPAWLDVSTGRAGFGEALIPSGDFLADLGKIAEFYKSKMPHCERFDVLAAQARGELESPGKKSG
ncbi:1-acyl-sn-glycerol-3-phosphate acyltransferase [Aurantiacibacter sp. D1-12]|uniref:1-acyl-sn-glycerol-3-phosphate acyltransferase n=1 Tax=Aurantiacibacter sp. D1-12 TaxID=2993658 RepID=UPI00237CDC40|nr:1-acyl-sn-glycerol-3-phosphate acyltransferase [Aurantiacibacter sp. D1-12]MDE1467364.1 1-acyl-sn-glycerol-3-phosphate acyltransferase [Aurantiacibacter sp. D1-12]